MLIIHQRKSAGSSLIRSLSDSLKLDLIDRPKRTVGNTPEKELVSYLESFQSIESPIISVHLHPTRFVVDWAGYFSGKMTVLLRNPLDAYEALYRHRNIDNTVGDINGQARRRQGLYEMYLFNFFWKQICEEKGFNLILFSELIDNYSAVLDKTCDYYEIGKPTGQHRLEKVRYSGRPSVELTYRDTRDADIPLKPLRRSPDYPLLPSRIWRRTARFVRRIVRFVTKKFTT